MRPLDLIPTWKDLILQREVNDEELEEIEKLSGLEIIIHNATWCPDCQRETIDLLAFFNKHKNLKVSLILKSYEDKEDYKIKKSQGLLEIKCLPTIIFKKEDKEIHRINEKSKDGGLSKELEDLISKL